MQEIVVHYETDEGKTGSVPVLIGDTWQTAEEFTREFLADHQGYTVTEVEEVM